MPEAVLSSFESRADIGILRNRRVTGNDLGLPMIE